MASTKPVSALEDWLRSQPGGYLHQNVHIVDDSSAGVHWRASGPVEPGTKLATVPHSIALSYLNALADDEYPVFSQRRRDFKIEAIGFFYLALQYLNRSKSNTPHRCGSTRLKMRLGWQTQMPCSRPRSSRRSTRISTSQELPYSKQMA
jgi:hypothetical protein